MEHGIPIDVANCWQRLVNLVDWALQTQIDPRDRAREIVGSLIAAGNELHRTQLQQMVSEKLVAQNGAHIPLQELQRQSAWLGILTSSDKALTTGVQLTSRRAADALEKFGHSPSRSRH